MKKILIILTILFFSTMPSYAVISNTEAMLQYNQGIDYYKIGQYDQAISSFREAIRLDPNYIDAYYNLGSVLEYLEQYDAALPVFKQIIVRKPEDYDSVYKAAWLSFKLGENQKAKTYLSIIPSTCVRGKDAQALAYQLNMSLGLPSTPTPTPTVKSKLSQNSNLYGNITAPTGITTDSEGNVYIAEFSTNTIFKITPDEKRLVYIKNPQINGPIGIAYDSAKNLYIANYNSDNVLKVSSLGEVSVLISNLKKPYYLYIDGSILLVSCQGSNSVLKYKLPK